MRMKTTVAGAAALAITIWLSTFAQAQSPPAGGEASAAEVQAQADYAAAQQAAAEAEAALGPLRTAMQEADTAYADASRNAQTKRQQATDAKNLAGEPGVNELAQAEANVPAAVQAANGPTTRRRNRQIIHAVTGGAMRTP